jgi:uncharacterized phage protein (TIGR02220 family)
MHYVKLFEELLDSTVWSENHTTVRVWITLLAMKGRDQIVRASIPGLTHRARVEIEECQLAIDKFLSPDPYSRSKEHEGRRIKEVEGGWLVLNGEKYRQRMGIDERREYQRIKQAEYRAAKANQDRAEESNSVNERQPNTAKEEVSYHLHARAALHWLNEKSGRHFRETAENLWAITLRLNEEGVTIEGIKAMIDRQARRWLKTKWADFLRPSTLFGKEFDTYYAGRSEPVINDAASNPKSEPEDWRASL